MVAGGEQSGYGILTVREQLWMFSQFYGLPSRDGWRRVDELIEAVGLDEQREQRVSTLSTGQRQKMNFARGLLNDPWIFFLDEPTLGLDVAAARSVRELVLAWKAAVPGRTVLLTTHYMAEADELCDRIAIVDHGRILALGTPDELKRRVQRESVFRLELDRLDGGVGGAPRACRASSARPRRPATRPTARATARPSRSTSPSTTTRRSAASSARSAGSASHILALRKSEPSLEDVFVELVGRGFDEEPTRRRRRDRIDRDDRDDPPAPDRRRPSPTRARARRAAASATEQEARRLSTAVRLPPDGEPAGGGRLDAAARSC